MTGLTQDGRLHCRRRWHPARIRNAEMNYYKDAVNRVILATDGDFNVGLTSRNELQSLIERKRKTRILNETASKQPGQ